MFQKKTLIIFLFTIIFVSGASLAVFFFTPFQKPSLKTLDSDIRIEACKKITAKEERQKCEESGYYSWFLMLPERALQEKNFLLCDLISDNVQRNTCYVSLAQRASNVDICSKITLNELKDDCEFQQNASKGDFSLCGQYKDEESRRFCYEKIIIEKEGQGEEYCNTLSLDFRNICREIYLTRQAILLSDYDICKKIVTPEGEKNCMKRLPLDSDGDKLSDNIERFTYSTDPFNKDTDGDGFSDGQEVKSGHDPLKE